jgi:hypothetical protein
MCDPAQNQYFWIFAKKSRARLASPHPRHLSAIVRQRPSLFKKDTLFQWLRKAIRSVIVHGDPAQITTIRRKR